MLTTYLKKLKEDRHLTAKQISDLSGIPESTISRILSGQTDNPGFDTIYAIVQAMGGSLDELTGIRTDTKQDLSPLIKLYEDTIRDKNKMIRTLMIACGLLVAVIVFVLRFGQRKCRLFPLLR